jgi:ABC-type sulfate transport system permease component
MIQWLIAFIFLWVAYPYIRGFTKQALASFTVRSENRRLVDAIGVGFAFTIVASLISVVVGLAPYALGSFVFVWVITGILEYFQSR